MSEKGIKVVIKVRPLIEDETNECVVNNKNQVLIEGESQHNFVFDNVFKQAKSFMPNK